MKFQKDRFFQKKNMFHVKYPSFFVCLLWETYRYTFLPSYNPQHLKAMEEFNIFTSGSENFRKSSGPAPRGGAYKGYYLN